MSKKIACVFVMLISSTAMAGIIGVGGTNANQHPELLKAWSKSEKVPVNSDAFRRLSARLSTFSVVNTEVTATSGKKIRRDFIKIFANGEGEVVDKEVLINLAPQDP